ncbi:MAG: hypothetical protein H6739_27685 [Alphaproteobacteria bacterium]|nr:hypothetical protein [Alphaproteobacteria bacterium]
MILALALAACTAKDAVDTAPPEPDLDQFEAQGPYWAGHATQALSWGDRTVQVHLWYPQQASSSFTPTPALLPEDASRFALLLEDAPPDCPTQAVAAVSDAPAAPVEAPLVLYSHCHECLAISGATVSAFLASHGYVVVAVDHTGNTLFDALDETNLPLNDDTLALRVGDLSAALDGVLDGRVALPDGLSIDATRIAAVGHSFGAVTVGTLAQQDGRIAAAMAHAAPMDNPLLGDVDITTLTQPLGFLVATEDNSITELGNELIRQNFAEAPGPAWKLELLDAGHWSLSDLCGLVDAFMPGCGEDERQTHEGETFTYLGPEIARSATRSATLAFLRAALDDDPDAAAWLVSGRPSGLFEAEVSP